MANKEFTPTKIPKCSIDPEAIHKARRKLQSLSKDGKINFNCKEREALLQLISDGKKELYPHQMAMDRYQSDLNDLAKLDKNTQPKQWEFHYRRIQEFEDKYCT